jgi:hypothetical protein
MSHFDSVYTLLHQAGNSANLRHRAAGKKVAKKALKQATDPIISALADTYTQAIDAGQDRAQAQHAIQTQFLASQANLGNIRTQVEAAIAIVYQTGNLPRDQHA